MSNQEWTLFTPLLNQYPQLTEIVRELITSKIIRSIYQLDSEDIESFNDGVWFVQYFKDWIKL
jgi:hypothetical protein